MQSKKVLIVTYYWPPAGGPGVQRWLKFAKYLPEFGFEPIIYAPENPSYPISDESLLKEVPENLKVIRKKIWEPYRFAEKLNPQNKKFKAGQFDVGKNQNWKSKLSVWIRGNFFIPDARVFWVKPSINFLKKYLIENQIDTIITTGPPHSLHLIGLALKKANPKLKWMADFRDPWTEISYYKHLRLSKLANFIHHKLERKVFKSADITIATSFTDAENFSKKGAKSVTITNGFDFEPGVSNSKTEKFSLSYIGILEQLRNPENLWQVLEKMIKQNAEFSNDFQLKFVGKIDEKILQDLERKNLKSHIKNMGYLSHDESYREMQSSDLLLITNFPQENSRGIIPGKLFEYLSTGNHIISFGPKNADVEKILEKTNSGKHFQFNDSAKIEEFILKTYNQWKLGNSQNKTSNIEEFSRRNLTKKLAEVLNGLA